MHAVEVERGIQMHQNPPKPAIVSKSSFFSMDKNHPNEHPVVLLLMDAFVSVFYSA